MMQSSEPAARALFSSSDEEPEPAVDLFERVVILKPRPLLCVCSLCQRDIAYEDESLHICCNSVCSQCRAEAAMTCDALLCAADDDDLPPLLPLHHPSLQPLPQYAPGRLPAARRREPLCELCFFCCGEQDTK